MTSSSRTKAEDTEAHTYVGDENAAAKRPARRRVRVTFVGFEAFWMQVLVDGLTERFSETLDCRWMMWPSTWPQRIRFLVAMLRSDLVIRVGMPFEFESETNRLWLHWISRSRRTRGVNYWIGYDVKLLRDRLTARTPTADDLLAFDALTHWSGGPNMTEALQEVGVPAQTVVCPSPSRPIPPLAPPLPAKFRALLYWRDATSEYSSGPQLVEAARRLPDIEFDVVGATGSNLTDPPPNLTFHGRVSDMDRMYERSTVAVRAVEWDSVPGGIVEEALLFGRHVLYSFEFPHTIHVPHADEEALVQELARLRDLHNRGELGLNLEGRQSIIEAWVPDTRWAALAEHIVDLHHRDLSQVPAAGPSEVVGPAGIEAPEVRIASGSALTLATKMIGLGTSFVIGVLVARIFGPEGKGALSVIMQVPGLLVLLLDLGISTSIIYFVSRRELAPGAAGANALVLSAVLGVLGAPVVVMLLSGPFALIPNVTPVATAIAVAAVPLGLLAGWLTGICVGLGDLRLPLRFVLASSATTVLGVAVLWGTGNGSLTGVVAASVAGTLVGLVVYALGLRRRLRPFKADVPAARRMAGFSVKAYLSGLAGLLHERQDVLLLGWLAGAGAVGLYSVGVSFAEIAWYVPGALGSAILAKGGRRSEASAVEYTTQTTRVAVVFMTVTLLVSLVAVPFLIPLVYGQAFAPAALAFMALTPGILADGVSRILWSYQITRGRIYWQMSVGTMLLNIAVVLALAPTYGAVGAALASSVSYVALAVLVVRRFCADTDATVTDVLLPKQADLRIISRTAREMARSWGHGRAK